MRWRIADWPMIVKLGLGPLVALIMMAVVSWIGTSGLNSQVEQLSEVVETNLKGGTELSQLKSELSEANGELYRIATLQAAEAEDLDLMSSMEALRGRVDSIINGLDQYKTKYMAGMDTSSIDQSVEELVRYRDSIEVIESMLEIDFASAVSLVRPFEENYTKLRDNLTEIVEQGVRASEARASAAQDDAASIAATYIGVTIGSFVIVISLSVLITLNTVKSMNAIASATQTLAEGNKEIDTVSLQRLDELGGIVTSLEFFKEALIRTEIMQREQEEARVRAEADEKVRIEEKRNREEVAAKELQLERERAEAERRAALLKLADSFDATVSSLVGSASASVGNVRDSAGGVFERAKTTVAGSGELDGLIQSVSGSMSTVSAATEELTSSISEISRQVTESAAVAGEAVQETQRTSKSVSNLSDAASRIGEVVKLINDIADQTNLLALNATIEAARAGEAGKGFAVVASEVKSLANQTASATQEIAAQVHEMQSVTSSVVEATSSINRINERVNQIAGDISIAVAEQGKATDEIAQTVQQATSGLYSIADNSTKVSEMASENGQSAGEMVDIAQSLQVQFEELSSEVNRFVTNIRGD